MTKTANSPGNASASSLPAPSAVVIDAARIFRCAHTYVAVKEAGVLLFLCASCGYKTELLPLRKPAGASAGPAERVPIRRMHSQVRSRTPLRRTAKV